MKTYAIGDVHGMLVLLRRVLRWIDVDAGDEPARVIFLGDYIDRGPDSAGVVKLLMSGPENPRHKWVCLKGNHEVMLVAARRIDSAIPMWVNNGGRECLRSYADMYPNSPTQQVIPDVVFEWIENLPILYTDSKRVYVHAALDPDSPLDQQTETFALWGRLDEKEYVGWETPRARPHAEDARPGLRARGRHQPRHGSVLQGPPLLCRLGRWSGAPARLPDR